jgi:adhesin transport system outer membrane protein
MYLTIAGLYFTVNFAGAAEIFSINDALHQAMLTNPAVGEASANRRATQSELRQTQSTLLPQVRIDATIGPEKFDQTPGFISPSLQVPTVGAGPWRNGNQESACHSTIAF